VVEGDKPEDIHCERPPASGRSSAWPDPRACITSIMADAFHDMDTLLGGLGG
jgi:hypothetical protein